MTTWRDIREKLKPQDRYYEAYDNPEGFWVTLDSRIVAWTMRLPKVIGIPLRVIYSIVGLSNRYEPMPIGNCEDVTYRWNKKAAWKRYLLWRVRNPWEDFRKFYAGFASCKDVKCVKLLPVFRIWLAKFKTIPFRIPFPYFKWCPGRLDLMIGWKSRGIPSITVRL